eukprot:1156865-Pelagomonas_calceolata.AAC.5
MKRSTHLLKASTQNHDGAALLAVVKGRQTPTTCVAILQRRPPRAILVLKCRTHKQRMPTSGRQPACANQRINKTP